ncbi:MAG: hypothetical protein ACRDE2_00195 [Chitinophagaceae bacterium]
MFDLLSQEEKEIIVNNALRRANEERKIKNEREEMRIQQQEFENDRLSPWTSKRYFEFIKTESVRRFNKELILDEFNCNTIKRLCTYFCEDKFFEKKGCSLKKGLYVYGNIGCGKTFLMNLFRINKKRCYRVFSTRRICDDYQQIGAPVLQEFSDPLFYVSKTLETFNHTEFGRCFDDLGGESIGRSYWGNRTIPMREIICYIYEKSYPFFYYHITSNLAPTELEAIYGARTYSRMKEMFNFIKLTGNDRRQ